MNLARTLLWVKLALLLLVLAVMINSVFGIVPFRGFQLLAVGRDLSGYTEIVGEAVIEASKIHKIDVDFSNGDIDVLHHEGADIILKYDAENHAQAMYKTDGNTLRVTTKMDRIGFGITNRSDTDITVYIPNNSILDYSIDSSSGNCTVSINGKDVDVDTSSGNIEVEGKYSEVKVDTSSGNIFLKGEYSKVSVDSSSGEITIAVNDSITDGVRVDSSSSDLVVIDSTSGFTLDYDSSSGRIKDTKNDKEFKSEWYEVGNGTVKISFDTSSGNFIVT